jgi:hypothetical protein
MKMTLSTPGILKAVENIGRDLRAMSQPNYWKSYRNENARRYWAPLAKTREAYAAIRDGGDPSTILENLIDAFHNNAHREMVRLIIRAINDDLEGTYFTIRDGDLVTIYE